MDNTELTEHEKLILDTQTAAFLRWCDSEDLAAFYDPKHHTQDLLRLAYIALAVGYRLLALNIIANIDAKEFERFFAPGIIRDERKVKLEQMYWVAVFMAKQPKGKLRNRLLKRIVKTGL